MKGLSLHQLGVSMRKIISLSMLVVVLGVTTGAHAEPTPSAALVCVYGVSEPYGWYNTIDGSLEAHVDLDVGCNRDVYRIAAKVQSWAETPVGSGPEIINGPSTSCYDTSACTTTAHHYKTPPCGVLETFKHWGVAVTYRVYLTESSSGQDATGTTDGPPKSGPYWRNCLTGTSSWANYIPS